MHWSPETLPEAYFVKEASVNRLAKVSVCALDGPHNTEDPGNFITVKSNHRAALVGMNGARLPTLYPGLSAPSSGNATLMSAQTRRSLTSGQELKQ